jgi:carbonic anhydrase
MDKLFDGYRRFRDEVWPGERDRYEALSKGQSPHTLVVACSDSRVDPQTIFGAAPGELFVVRNVAALVPPYEPDAGYHGTSAALEFGVRVLRVAKVVVLAHAQCGGVKAMVEGAPPEARDFVPKWMEIAEPVLWPVGAPTDPAGHLCHFETEVVALTLRNLMTYPWLRQRVEDGDLTLHGLRFDIHTGVLSRVTDAGLVPVD